MPTRHHEFDRGIQCADHMSPQTGWMIIHLYLQTSGYEASSYLVYPSSQWGAVTGIIVIILLLCGSSVIKC